MKTVLKLNLNALCEYLPTTSHNSENDQPFKTIKGWSKAKIHHGFAVSYREVAEFVLSRLRVLLAENRWPVFLAGHSLGGALATVCSLDILLSDLPLSADQVTVATFGLPKCVNAAWCKVAISLESTYKLRYYLHDAQHQVCACWKDSFVGIWWPLDS